jgi:hypothetical protein
VKTVEELLEEKQIWDQVLSEPSLYRQSRELAMTQVLFMAEQYARERNPEVFRFPGSRAKCSVVNVVAPWAATSALTAGFMQALLLNPPVRVDDERYQTGDVVWTVATRVVPDASLGTALVRSWEAKLARAEAEGDEEASAQLRKDLAGIWKDLRYSGRVGA